MVSYSFADGTGEEVEAFVVLARDRGSDSQLFLSDVFPKVVTIWYRKRAFAPVTLYQRWLVIVVPFRRRKQTIRVHKILITTTILV